MNTRILISLIVIAWICNGSARGENEANPNLIRKWGFRAEGEFGMNGPRMSEMMRAITAVSFESFADKDGTSRLLRMKIDIRCGAGFSLPLTVDMIDKNNKEIASLHGAIENGVATIGKRLERYETVPLPTGALKVVLDYKGRTFTGFKAKNSIGGAGETLVEQQRLEAGEYFEAQSLGLYTMVKSVLDLLPGHSE